MDSHCINTSLPAEWYSEYRLWKLGCLCAVCKWKRGKQVSLDFQNYLLLVEGPGVARGKKFEKIKFLFNFLLKCPQKNSAQSVQLFGRLNSTYIYICIHIQMSCFITKIIEYRVTHKGCNFKDDCTKFKLSVFLISWFSETLKLFLYLPNH